MLEHVIKLSRETNSFQDFSNKAILCRTVPTILRPDMAKASPFTAIKYFLCLGITALIQKLRATMNFKPTLMKCPSTELGKMVALEG